MSGDLTRIDFRAVLAAMLLAAGYVALDEPEPAEPVEAVSDDGR